MLCYANCQIVINALLYGQYAASNKLYSDHIHEFHMHQTSWLLLDWNIYIYIYIYGSVYFCKFVCVCVCVCVWGQSIGKWIDRYMWERNLMGSMAVRVLAAAICIGFWGRVRCDEGGTNCHGSHRNYFSNVYHYFVHLVICNCRDVTWGKDWCRI